MTYDEALRFWQGRINYETRAAEPHDLKLERMAALLKEMGNPQGAITTIHIAGTKGKGSTAAMIAAIAKAARWSVGLFTSPHLERVEERFQKNGEPISRDEFVSHMRFIAETVDILERRDGLRFTFFEIATALAWNFFEHLDLAVMEVGLGGRFDSTNVCRPNVTVITSIGFDHMAQLGHTLAEIAFQKAGILKPGVPCVVGELPTEAMDVVKRVAKDVRAPLHVAGVDFPARNAGTLSLRGDHQAANAALAVKAVAILNPALNPHTPTLATMTWPARIELVRRDPHVILDCAHNVPSAEALVNTLVNEFPDRIRKTCIFAVSNDKQYELMLPILATYFNHFIFTQYGINPRCVPPEKLMGLVPSTATAEVVIPAATAWERARHIATVEDLIAITGSVFLAGELRSYFKL